MNVESAVVHRLLETSAVTDLVGTRIRQLKLRQPETFPAVRVQLIDEQFTSHLRGVNATRPGRVQVDIYAKEVSGVDVYEQAHAVADAVFDALTGEPWTDSGSPATIRVTAVPSGERRPIYEAEELREVRVIQEFAIVSRRL